MKSNSKVWKGIAIAGIWLACSLVSIFGEFNAEIFWWALWGTFWVTIA